MNYLKVLKSSVPQLSRRIPSRNFQASTRALGGGGDHHDGEHHAHPVIFYCVRVCERERVCVCVCFHLMFYFNK